MGRTIGATLVALAIAAPALASDVDALVAAFDRCLVAETGEPLSDAERDALGDAAPRLIEQLSLDCEGACADAIDALDCGALAAGLGGTPAVDADALPDWARAFAGTVAERALVCLRAETGENATDDERDAVAHYQLQLAAALVELTDQLGCQVSADHAAACVTSLRSLPCDALASGLLDGPSAVAAASGDACGEMFACDLGRDDEAIDALFEAEIGNEESGQ